jgi:hypothetical protein
MIGLKITNKKGFHITFENGYTVSVQFGPGNYCDNYNRAIGKDDEECGMEGCANAECAIWAKDGNMIKHRLFDGDSVSHLSTPNEILKLLNWASKQKEV